MLARGIYSSIKAEMATSLTEPYGGSALFFNGQRLRGLAAWANDGWQVTLSDPKMSSVTVYAFNGYRLCVFNLGYDEQPSKTSQASFNVVAKILERAGQPLSAYVSVSFARLQLVCFGENKL
jgi:hypothetical protein